MHSFRLASTTPLDWKQNWFANSETLSILNGKYNGQRLYNPSSVLKWLIWIEILSELNIFLQLFDLLLFCNVHNIRELI